MTFIDAGEEALEWWNDNSEHYVSSSNVTSFRYDREKRELFITFHGGRRYKYFNVDAGTAEGLATAPSPGQWFHANLRGAPFEKE